MTGKMVVDLKAMGNPGKILIVRLKALGDIVLSIPFIRGLRSNFEDSWIAYLCLDKYSEALRGDTGLDEILKLREGLKGQFAAIRQIRKIKPDIVIDLLSSPRSALITFLSGGSIRIGMDVGARHNWCFHHVMPRTIVRKGRVVRKYTAEANMDLLEMMNLEVDYSCPESGFPAAQFERSWAEGYINSLGVDCTRLAGVNPVAKYQAKGWPLERFIRLSRLIIEELDMVPLILWGPGEEETADKIVSRVEGAVKAPPTGISRLGALISGLRIMVTLDSGPKHMAVLQGIPTVTLFGPTDERVWDPLDERHRVITHQVPCHPCHKRECEDNVCIRSITPLQVIESMKSILRGADT